MSDGQAVKALIKVKIFDRAVAGVGTESIGVTTPWNSKGYAKSPEFSPALGLIVFGEKSVATNLR